MKTLFPLMVLCAGLLTGCATNPIAKSYQSSTKEWPAGTQQRLLPPAAGPRVVMSTNLDEDSRRLKAEGYVAMGMSEFQGDEAVPDQLIAQAKKVGADMVLFSSRFSHLEQGVTSTVIPQSGPTYYYYNPNYARSPTSPSIFPERDAYATGAYGRYPVLPNMPMMTASSSTVMNTPYQRPVFDQKAVFWRRTK